MVPAPAFPARGVRVRVRVTLVSLVIGASLSCGDSRAPASGRAPGAAGDGAQHPAREGSAPREVVGGANRETDPADYVSAILLHRREKDAFFRTDPESPVPSGQRAVFPPLTYYPVDPSWCLKLPMIESEKPETVVLVTGTGEQRVLEKRGRIEFLRDGARFVLHVYRERGDARGEGTFWIPFVDAGASGGETYPAGRYLDAERQPDGTLLVDFNLAYNPYCAYGLDYSCPITPRENRLSLAIRAGERGFQRGE